MFRAHLVKKRTVASIAAASMLVSLGGATAASAAAKAQHGGEKSAITHGLSVDHHPAGPNFSDINPAVPAQGFPTSTIDAFQLGGRHSPYSPVQSLSEANERMQQFEHELQSLSDKPSDNNTVTIQNAVVVSCVASALVSVILDGLRPKHRLNYWLARLAVGCILGVPVAWAVAKVARLIFLSRGKIATAVRVFSVVAAHQIATMPRAR